MSAEKQESKEPLEQIDSILSQLDPRAVGSRLILEFLREKVLEMNTVNNSFGQINSDELVPVLVDAICLIEDQMIGSFHHLNAQRSAQRRSEVIRDIAGHFRQR